ncbi:hypothetical protein U6B65_12335 [Oscillospiraceae bacterium MB08-C2-2]|nr:hypothetical protein U6B65_12335 [Oscillospiraceae bacterium MB08-C2-2]
MDSRFIWTAAAMIAVTGISVVLVNLTSERSPIASTEPISHVEIPADQPSVAKEKPQEPERYMLKAYQGRIGVFIIGREEPEMVLDVYVKFLPEYDRGQLEQGVEARDTTQLAALIEDYSS